MKNRHAFALLPAVYVCFAWADLDAYVACLTAIWISTAIAYSLSVEFRAWHALSTAVLVAYAIRFYAHALPSTRACIGALLVLACAEAPLYLTKHAIHWRPPKRTRSLDPCRAYLLLSRSIWQLWCAYLLWCVHTKANQLPHSDLINSKYT